MAATRATTPDAAPDETLPAFSPSLLERTRIRARLLRFGAFLVRAHAELQLGLALAHDDAARDALRARRKPEIAAGLLRIFGIEVHVVREADAAESAPPPGRPRLVVANHRTAFDIGLLMREFGGVMLSRGDLSSWPIIGALAREGNTIFVDRADGHSGARAIRSVRRALREGATVSVYPEGTTYVGDRVRPFQPGAFAAIRGLPGEVVPVGIAYDPGVEYFHIDFLEHLARVAARRRTVVAIAIGAPIPVSGSSQEMAERAESSVRELVGRARALHAKVRA